MSLSYNLSPESNQSLLLTTKLKQSKRVGNSECWTLVDTVFRRAGVRRPGKNLRVWGKRVKNWKSNLRPGDVVELHNARFKSGNRTFYSIGKHCAIVLSVNQGVPTMCHQNWGGKRSVTFLTLDLKNLTAGKLFVYRPQ